RSLGDVKNQSVLLALTPYLPQDLGQLLHADDGVLGCLLEGDDVLLVEFARDRIVPSFLGDVPLFPEVLECVLQATGMRAHGVLPATSFSSAGELVSAALAVFAFSVKAPSEGGDSAGDAEVCSALADEAVVAAAPVSSAEPNWGAEGAFKAR